MPQWTEYSVNPVRLRRDAHNHTSILQKAMLFSPDTRVRFYSIHSSSDIHILKNKVSSINTLWFYRDCECCLLLLRRQHVSLFKNMNSSVFYSDLRFFIRNSTLKVSLSCFLSFILTLVNEQACTSMYDTNKNIN